MMGLCSRCFSTNVPVDIVSGRCLCKSCKQNHDDELLQRS